MRLYFARNGKTHIGKVCGQRSVHIHERATIKSLFCFDFPQERNENSLRGCDKRMSVSDLKETRRDSRPGS